MKTFYQVFKQAQKENSLYGKVSVKMPLQPFGTRKRYPNIIKEDFGLVYEFGVMWHDLEHLMIISYGPNPIYKDGVFTGSYDVNNYSCYAS